MGKITTEVNSNEDISRWIETIHSVEHIESIKKSFPLAHEVATAAVAGSLLAVDKVLTKEATNVFFATIPPLHPAFTTFQS